MYFLSFLLVLVRCLWAGDVSSPDPHRPDLARLAEKGKEKVVVVDEFEYPYLLTQTAVAAPFDVQEASRRIQHALSRGRLPVTGTLVSEKEPKGVSAEAVPLPAYVSQGDQLEGIQKCKPSYCKMKLHKEREIPLLHKAPEAKKVEVYHNLVLERLKNYQLKRELLGYEERDSIIPMVHKAFKHLDFFIKGYPVLAAFFVDGFWKRAAPPGDFKTSFFRQEKLYLDIDKMQPVWRIGEVFHFAPDKRSIFVEMHVYSNHYFDSSFTIYEALPFGKGSVIAMTDIMELDELKKSAFIRMLYAGKMQDAVEAYQFGILKGLLSGS